MTDVLHVNNQIVTADEMVPLLAGYQLLPQLLREMLTDQAIAHVKCTSEEQEACLQQFYQKYNLPTPEAQQAWLQQNYLTPDQLTALETRGLKIEKFKRATWGNKLESYFLNRKTKLDRAIYRLIRTNELGIAQELYFRIREEEESFADLAREYSQGPEAETGGLVGPVELGTLHQNLAKILTVSQPGQVWTPVKLGQWYVVVRLEKIIPAQLDESMRQLLLNELFRNWLDEQMQQLGPIRPRETTMTGVAS